MRQIIYKMGGSEKPIFIFASGEEREEFFRGKEKALKESQLESVEKLRRACMEAIKKVDDAYHGELGKLRYIRDKSLLESDLEKTP